MKRPGTLVAILAAGSMMSAQAQSAVTTHPKTKHRVQRKKQDTTATEVRELRDQMQQQQQEIDALKTQLASRQEEVNAAQKTATDAQAQAIAAAQANAQLTTQAQQSSSQIQELQNTVGDLKTSSVGLQETVVANQQRVQDEVESPAVLHYKGVRITPVAFFAAEGVWRQHSVNSDVNTPFNSIPFPSASEGHVSELNFSGRQSRIGGLFEATASNVRLSGYFEGDFLGTGTSSNNNQSNSYVYRQRQIWGKAEFQNGFTITGGQTWSLVTENRRSTDTRTEIQPQTIDAQYLVGYSWERQPGFRVQQRFGSLATRAFTVAVSAEQAQITGFTVASSVSAGIPTQYFFGGIGQNGGLYNAAASNGGTSNITTYANNVAPDVIVKAAFDIPAFHFEFGGVARFLRDYYLPSTAGGTAAAPSYTYGANYLSHTSAAGGAFGSARVYLGKFAEVAVQAMAGQGVGRYGSSQLADATLRPDQTLEPIRNYHGLFSLETHPTRKLDVFAYYGGEYAQRTVYTTAQGDLIGYGPANLSDTGCYNVSQGPSTTVGAGVGGGLGAVSCSSPTRYIQEPMVGFVYRVISNPSYGRLQYSMTYSYIQRNLWSGVGSTTTPTGPRATENMIHASMRYYIP